MSSGAAYANSGAIENGTLRWGDYFSAKADPNNANAFWISNEFTSDGQSWSTAVTHVVRGSPTAQQILIQVVFGGFVCFAGGCIADILGLFAACRS
jgi:hypothetical protein